MKTIQHKSKTHHSFRTARPEVNHQRRRLIHSTCAIALFLATLGSIRATPVQWQISQGGNGNWYEAVLVGTNRINWVTAEAAAEAAGGHLATIGSSAENAFVHGLAATNEAAWAGGSPWLGGYQPNGSTEPAGGWLWVTGELWSFTNWEAGEPNNFSGPENFLTFWATISGRTSGWNDTQDDPMPSYMVEWESPPPLNLINGLIGYFPFDGTANDASGNGNHGSVHGGVTFVPSVFGSAAHFGGGIDDIECNATIGNFGQSDFTIACWVRTTMGGALVNKRVSCDSSSSYVDLRVGRSQAPGPLPQDALFEVCSSGGSDYAYLESPLIYTNGLWHHLAVIRSGNKLITYTDGTKTGETATSSTATIQNLSSLLMGRSACTGVDTTPPFVGEIDEVRIYNRALSSFEILALNSSGAPWIAGFPSSQTVSSGGNANFSVTALGTLPLSYQWHFNGSPLVGKTTPTLDLIGVQSNQAGTYSVTVTNTLGITSASNVLSVLDLKMFAGLVLAGPVGTNYKIEYIPAFGGTNAWQTLTNITLTASPSAFFDLDSPSQPKRFYRASLVP